MRFSNLSKALLQFNLTFFPIHLSLGSNFNLSSCVKVTHSLNELH